MLAKFDADLPTSDSVFVGFLKSFKPPVGAIPQPVFPAYDETTVPAEALKVMTDVWKNEETRFGNLNTRGVAVVSAASLVTTILGFFMKNVLDTTSAGLQGGARTVAIVGVGAALGIVLFAIGLVVFGVLRPGPRPIFGDNVIVTGSGGPLTTAAIDEAAFKDYGAIYAALATRSRRKAYWLTMGYYAFFLSLVVSAACTVFIVSKATPPKATTATAPMSITTQ